jgi:hypothetical protein
VLQTDGPALPFSVACIPTVGHIADIGAHRVEQTELERVKGFGAVEGGHQTLERLAEWLTDRPASAAP